LKNKKREIFQGKADFFADVIGAQVPKLFIYTDLMPGITIAQSITGKNSKLDLVIEKIFFTRVL